MKAKSVNEVQNFERGLDPKKSMDIGLYWKKDIKDLIEGLKKIGIKAKAVENHHYSGPVFDFEIENLFDEDDEENIGGYHLSYITKKAAEGEGGDEEGWEPGFDVQSDEGGLLLNTTNVNQVIKFFAKMQFGMSLNARIVNKEKELNRLKEIKEYIDSITIPYLR